MQFSSSSTLRLTTQVESPFTISSTLLEHGPDPTALMHRYDELTHIYPIRKLLAGYNTENADWSTISPIVFFLGAMDILQQKNVAGASIYYHNFSVPHCTKLLRHTPDSFHPLNRSRSG